MVRGVVALVGSGELSGTMVETHKALLSRNKIGGKALFLDTPAGFQGNVDLISRRAVDYFARQVGHDMEIASFKSAESSSSQETDEVFRLLGEAGFVLMGPGSPTYTVRQLKETPIPALLNAMVTRGGCLVAASAAALTAGSHTLPVYEIYKVGEPLHWVEGLNLLGHLGLELIIIPHWNNAEGGNHDTRYCYMGEARFRFLEEQLPPGAIILGIDEHTACILDFALQEAVVEGLGRVTVRRRGAEQYFARGERIPFEQMLDGFAFRPAGAAAEPASALSSGAAALFSGAASTPREAFWENMHVIEAAFHRFLEGGDENNWAAVTTLLLDADRLLWQAQLDLENPEFISQGREIFREMIVLAGIGVNRNSAVTPQKLTELVNKLVELREQFRRDKRWAEADRIRSLLRDVGVILEDTNEGPRWRFER